MITAAAVRISGIIDTARDDGQISSPPIVKVLMGCHHP